MAEKCACVHIIDVIVLQNALIHMIHAATSIILNKMRFYSVWKYYFATGAIFKKIQLYKFSLRTCETVSVDSALMALLLKLSID